MARRHDRRMARVDAALATLVLPEAVFKTCPWQPRELIETGLHQWLRCCGAALGHRQTIGMPSRAVDEAWHGLILCTAMYSAFCDRAYGRYLHHYPEGTAPAGADSMAEQLGRTVVAWSLVAKSDERCVLWDLDRELGLEHPWGLDLGRVSTIQTAAANLSISRGKASEAVNLCTPLDLPLTMSTPQRKESTS